MSLDSLFGKEDTILTERVLEKAVRAAAWEEEDSQQAEDLEPAPPTQGQTPCEDGAQMDMAQEDTASQQQRESTDKRESDPARSFGEYISNIVNMSLKSGMNGLGKAMDTLKKIDLKNLDLKGLDQVVNDKVKRPWKKVKRFISSPYQETEKSAKRKWEMTTLQMPGIRRQRRGMDSLISIVRWKIGERRWIRSRVRDTKIFPGTMTAGSALWSMWAEI